MSHEAFVVINLNLQMKHKILIRNKSCLVKYCWFYGRKQDLHIKRTYVKVSVYEYSIEIYDMWLK
jgi:hypothetical protein